MTILSNGHQWKYSEFVDNKNYLFDKSQILKLISKNEIDDAYNIILAVIVITILVQYVVYYAF